MSARAHAAKAPRRAQPTAGASKEQLLAHFDDWSQARALTFAPAAPPVKLGQGQVLRDYTNIDGARLTAHFTQGGKKTVVYELDVPSIRSRTWSQPVRVGEAPPRPPLSAQQLEQVLDAQLGANVGWSSVKPDGVELSGGTVVRDYTAQGGARITAFWPSGEMANTLVFERYVPASGAKEYTEPLRYDRVPA